MEFLSLNSLKRVKTDGNENIILQGRVTSTHITLRVTKILFIFHTTSLSISLNIYMYIYKVLKKKKENKNYLQKTNAIKFSITSHIILPFWAVL